MIQVRISTGQYITANISYAWRLFLALFHLSDDAVCEVSKSLGPDDDFHSVRDSILGKPWHMYSHICRRCGKSFNI